MASAKNRAQFVQAWADHIREMDCLFLQAGTTHADYVCIRTRLLDEVQRAADNSFGPKAVVTMVSGVTP